MLNRRTFLTALMSTATESAVSKSVMATGLITAAGTVRAAETNLSAEGFTVTDLVGRTVTFVKRPERFVVANYILNFLMTGGAVAVPKIVALAQDGWEDTRVGEYEVLTKAFPALKALPSIGGYHDNILNSERILSLRPDVLLIGIAQYHDNAARIAVLERAGVHVVVLDYHAMLVKNHTASTRLIGMLLGREEVAQAQCRRYEEALADLEKRIAALPPEKRGRRTYVECGNEGVGRFGNTYNGTVLWGAILAQLQAKNIAADMKAPYAPIARETLIAANPQTIFIAGSIWRNAAEADSMRMGLTVTKEDAQKRLAGFAARPLFARTEARRTGEIYAVDHGSLRTIADFVFPQFMAKALYPDTFADLNPDEEIRRFYAAYLPEVDPAGTYFLKAE